jgi:hypothetical protein
MLEFSAEAVKETTRLALVSVPRTPHSPKATLSKKEADVGPNGYPLYEACRKYHYGGDDRCFKLHPELLRTKPIAQYADIGPETARTRFGPDPGQHPVRGGIGGLRQLGAKPAL